ncbi:MAG: hypothetical protein K9J37_12020 [Saprospiraceae bacterium]|nr:hypothetical protein [Saprospiraceae bacterium]MCF8250635.1 hypothetical protein [Saprospiraceae bacterium]MCF8280772.1 hypothetical protein [Bacteroidales bacterium]MCF8312487.1 hypothetical protein [Saprospiraceae bacterium]MCF8440833.1 hypothetical protein [Saprospiraceae bacterium]
MKALFTLAVFLFVANLAVAQQTNKWMKDENNILTVTINKDATKAELLDLKKQIWDTYQIRLDYDRMDFSRNGKKLDYLSLRIEMPTGEVGTVGTSFVAPKQVIGFHWDRNPETYDEFGVWTK